MIITIILIIMIIIAIFMYLVIVGADICKTEEERIMEDQEQIKALEEWRKKHDKQNKKKRHLFSRLRKNSRK